jgi:hypothetical protein
MAEKKSNKPEFTFTKTKKPEPEGELQKMAREYEEDAKEKKANEGKQTPSEAKAMLEKKRAVAKKKAEAIKAIKNKAGAGSKLAQGMPAFKAGGALKAPASPGLKKLPTEVRNKMGYMKAGGAVKKCKRDGIAVRGRTKGRTV